MLDQIVEIPLLGRTIGAADGSAKNSPPGVTLPAFVAGPENRLVASAFCRLLQAESSLAHGIEPAASRQLPRVLSLFGQTGTGKTHLARGLVRHWQRSRRDDEAEYVTAQDFRRQFHDAINENAINTFRQRLRSRVLLAIDDLHTVPNDPHLMQELRHAIDALHEEGGTLLVTSARPIGMLANLSPDVRSRLSSGLMLQLSPPGSAARLRIVRHISSALRQPMSDETLCKLADGVHGAARQLLGALFELSADQQLRRGSLDDANSPNRLAKEPTLREIITVVAKYYKLPQKVLKSKSRTRFAVLARATAVALARELTSQSYQQIGRALGGRDHTTIMHNYQNIQRQRQQDLAIQEALDDLRRILLGH